MVKVHGKIGSNTKINTVPFDNAAAVLAFYHEVSLLFIQKIVGPGVSWYHPSPIDKKLWGVDEPLLYFPSMHGVVRNNTTRQSITFSISCVKLEARESKIIAPLLKQYGSVFGNRVDSVKITGFKGV